MSEILVLLSMTPQTFSYPREQLYKAVCGKQTLILIVFY